MISKSPFYREWWYFVAFTSCKKVIAGNFLINGKASMGKLWVSLYRPGKKAINIIKRIKFPKVNTEKTYIKFNKNIFEEIKGICHIQIEEDKISLNIKGKTKFPTKISKVRYKFGKNIIDWIIPVFKGKFEGILKIDGNIEKIKGIFFQDHVKMNIYPCKELISFKGWIWGLKYLKDQSLLFVKVLYQKPFILGIRLKGNKIQRIKNLDVFSIYPSLTLLKTNSQKIFIETPNVHLVTLSDKFLSNFIQKLVFQKRHCYNFKNGEINYIESMFLRPKFFKSRRYIFF